MTSAEPVSPTERTVSQRARLRALLARRKRFWRSVAVFVVVAVAMVLAALLHRDTQQLRTVRKQATVVADALQENYARRRDPPLSFPKLPERYEKLHRHYYFNIFYANQQKSQGQAGACCLREPLRFFVRTEGRVVILFDGEQFSSQWMPEGEFRARAENLGFGSLLKESQPHYAPQP